MLLKIVVLSALWVPVGSCIWLIHSFGVLGVFAALAILSATRLAWDVFPWLLK